MHLLARASVMVPLCAMAFAASAQTTETDTEQFRVTINVAKACEIVSASDIDFGSVSAGAGTPTATGTIQVSCSTGSDYSLGLDMGQHESAGVRNMVHVTLASTAPEIPYTLSSDSSHSVPWTNSAPDWVTGTGTGMTSPVSHTVYAQATLSGAEPPGTYEDYVTATLTF